MNLFPPLPPDARRILENIPALIDEIFPIPARFRSALPADVAELSRFLTSGRGERPLLYLNRPHLLSAYLRFFLPWNLYRLCRLLPALDIGLAEHDVIIDIGAGPLTVTLALWIARPELRSLPLIVRCIDRSGSALEAGKKLFSALSGKDCLWKIHTVKKSVNENDRLGGEYGGKAPFVSAREKPAALVCAVNVFNEMYGDILRISPERLKQHIDKAARLLCQSAAGTAALLVVEPGVPGSGRFISLLRDALTGRKCPPHSPCPHYGICPVPGGVSKTGKSRWCHFAFDTEDAPKALHRLSAAAGIPKERAVLSFLLAGRNISSNKNFQPQLQNPAEAVPARVITDAFPLPQGRLGRYCCSERGLVLVEGERGIIEKLQSGAFINVRFSNTGERDPKSGALIVCEGYIPRPSGA